MKESKPVNESSNTKEIAKLIGIILASAFIGIAIAYIFKNQMIDLVSGRLN